MEEIHQRDAVLTELQERTQMDFDVCVNILEGLDWNIELALEAAAEMLGQRAEMPAASLPRHSSGLGLPVSECVEFGGTDTSASALNGEEFFSSESSPWLRQEGVEAVDDWQPVEISILWQDKTYTLSMLPSNTIGEVKERLEELTGVAVRHQLLFSESMQNPPNRTPLSSLKLGSSAQAVLVDDSHKDDGPAIATDQPEGDNDTPSDPASPSKTPDQWTHIRSLSPASSPPDTPGGGSDLEQDLSDGENVSWAMHAMQMRSHLPLMTESSRSYDEIVGAFQTKFVGRYGAIPFTFFIGSLQSAVAEARKTGKLLMVYLHNDKAIETNIFCKNTLASDEVGSIVKDEFLVWAWDITGPRNLDRFHQMVEGSPDFEILKRRATHPPVLAIFLPTNNGVDALHIGGFMYADELAVVFNEIKERYRYQIQAHKEDGQLRELQHIAREQEKQDQDAAYRLSLEQDRLKERQRQEEVQQEQERVRRIKEAEEKAKEKVLEGERRKEELARKVPEEPAADCGQSLCRMRFRLPDGRTVNRRFLGETTTIQDVLNYGGSLGFLEGQYNLVLSFPRRVLGIDMAKADTLAAARIRNETVNIESV